MRVKSIPGSEPSGRPPRPPDAARPTRGRGPGRSGPTPGAPAAREQGTTSSTFVAYLLSAEEVCGRLAVDPRQGLGEAEAAARLQRSGPNRLAAAPRTAAWRVLLAQFNDFMVLVLLGAVAISFFLGEHADGIAVLAIVAVNAALGFFQEVRAERSLDALRRLAAPAARVLRGGRTRVVPAEEVVPGDVLLLEAGDRTPADARLLECASLAAEESALTGESRPVGKDSAPLPPPRGGAVPVEIAPADRRNCVFQGSHIVRGRGRAVVVATGMGTEVGRIADLILEVGMGTTPLQRRLDALGRVLVLACLAISAAVVVAGVWQGETPYRMFLAGVSLAVAAIPEGLPAIVAIALALGVQRMISRNAIVRRLPAVETLGCATVVCADKTGTLTQNLMAVQRLFAAGTCYRVGAHGVRAEGAMGPAAERPVRGDLALEAPLEALPVPALAACVRIAVLCNDSVPGGAPGADPTETALCDLAVAVGESPESLRQDWPRQAEIPFESERRRMTVLCAGPAGACLATKGALEEVLARCGWVETPQGRRPLDARWAARIRREQERMAEAALRVLALAERRWPPEAGPPGVGGPLRAAGSPRHGSPSDLAEAERDLVFCGLVGLIDPPRPEVAAAIRRCHQAGVRAVMITGDHALTARAIARQIGLLPPGGRVVTGGELAGMGERELGAAVEETVVYARVSPADKLRIVRALRGRGHVVAMTGDGVNDAPAVKEADIGIAMGRGGTDVTREASALVLTDDNFATIVAAMEEGRAIYDNIRKFIRYLLACNTGEVLVMLLGTLLGLPLPLLPLQLLLVNLVTDGLPALALGVDPASSDVMRRPPRDPQESVFAGGLGKRIATRGTLIGLLSLGAFVFTLAETRGDVAAARTTATCTLVLSQLLHAFDARAERRPIWEVGVGGNTALLLAVGSSLAILLATLYIPPAAHLFHFAPPSAAAWGVALAAAVAGAVVAGAGEVVRRTWVRRTALVRVRVRRP